MRCGEPCIPAQECDDPQPTVHSTSRASASHRHPACMPLAATKAWLAGPTCAKLRQATPLGRSMLPSRLCLTREV